MRRCEDVEDQIETFRRTLRCFHTSKRERESGRAREQIEERRERESKRDRGRGDERQIDTWKLAMCSKIDGGVGGRESRAVTGKHTALFLGDMEISKIY
jgi:hypothetical protein